jgi:NAD(P)-dependent dehydrogenase (short-subunit alcohol dehydrogenase family)
LAQEIVPVSEFSDQVVFVTGAASGIGLGVAKAFYDAGAKVALGDFRTDALDALRVDFPDMSRVAFAQIDVRDLESVGNYLRAGEAALGPISVMVANAGIYPNTPVLEMAQEEWDRVMETNVRGVFLSCQAAARSMVSHEIAGKIITISSGAATSGRRGAAHYSASKAGVIMFTKVLAMELAEYRINVNCVSPGLIEVQSDTSPISAEYRAALMKSIPWGRSGLPGDIANAVLFLASPASDFITGSVLSVDGGSSAGRAFLPPSSPAANDATSQSSVR